ncbi:MAG: hypothetical protein JO211_13160 [Acidobacteriaceae bacterium]|nr:hypothetical protein [Acidobacteriaceae bacterium]
MRLVTVLLFAAAAILLCGRVSGQAVISAHSGVVHFSEGSVYLDDQPLEHKFAQFPNIKEGSTLRTEKGRAEVLLTPGVFLRLDENSAIRMRSNLLTDTRVEFLKGTVLVDAVDAITDNHVLLTYKDSEVRFPKQGVYRLDFDTATVQAYSGQAEITHDGKKSLVDDSHLFFLTLDLMTKKLDTGTEDEFYDWARERNNSISAENQVAAQSSGDVDSDDDLNALTGPLPNLGTPGGGLGDPNYPSPSYNYPVPNYSYPMGSILMNPFGVYGAGAPYYYPFPISPIVILARPYRYHGVNPHWPHSTPGSGSGWLASHPGCCRGGTLPISPVRPAYTAIRPLPSTAIRPVYSRPAVVARPAPAPAGMHAIGHR